MPARETRMVAIPAEFNGCSRWCSNLRAALGTCLGDVAHHEMREIMKRVQENLRTRSASLGGTCRSRRAFELTYGAKSAEIARRWTAMVRIYMLVERACCLRSTEEHAPSGG